MERVAMGIFVVDYFFVFLPFSKCSLHILLCVLISEILRPINAVQMVKAFLFLDSVKNLIPLQLVLLDQFLQPGAMQECTIPNVEVNINIHEHWVTHLLNHCLDQATRPHPGSLTKEACAQFARNHKATISVQAVKPGKVGKQTPRKVYKVIAV